MSIQGDRSFEQILSENDQAIHEMFQIPGILQKIKLNLQVFVNFCLNNEEFFREMIIIGIKIPMHGNPNRKQVAHVALEILTCDSDCIADLFVIDKNRQRIRLYSEDDDEVVEQIVTSEETGELVLTDVKKSEEESFPKKFGNLIDLLSYTDEKQENIDENCMNYLMKVICTLIRVVPEDLYQFFDYKPEYLDNLIRLTVFPSVCFGLVKLLNEVEAERYRSRKVKIILRIIQQLERQIGSDQFECVMELVDDLFSKNKFRSEEPDEIKIISNPLVAEEVIRYFVDQLLASTSEVVMNNALMYLLGVVKRMNVDEEKDPYSYYEDKNLGPTMEFQVDHLYANFGKLVGLSACTQDKQMKSTTLLSLYQLLYLMTKHSAFTKQSEQLGSSELMILLENYNSLRTNGMVKFYLVGLIETALMSSQKLVLLPDEKKKIKEMVEKMSEGEKQEAMAYNNKIRIMLASVIGSKFQHIYEKYSNGLCPNNYTNRRQSSIPELQFLKHFQPVEEKNGHSSNGKNNAADSADAFQDEVKKGLNLDILDMKIRRRQEKLNQLREINSKEQWDDEEEESKLDDPKVNPEVEENERAEKEKAVQECIEFYSKHMIIF